jgi:hypothetical protein
MLTIQKQLHPLTCNLDILGTWADTWLLSFNADKCGVLLFLPEEKFWMCQKKFTGVIALKW